MNEQIGNHFVTITLPPKFYRKSAIKQMGVMRNAFKSYCLNFFEKATGCVELTSKSNIHLHLIVNFRSDNESAYVNMLKFQDAAKQFSRIDCQLVKSMDDCLAYIKKDMDITCRVMDVSKKDIIFKYTRKDFYSDIPPESNYNKITLE